MLLYVEDISSSSFQNIQTYSPFCIKIYYEEVEDKQIAIFKIYAHPRDKVIATMVTGSK